MFFACGIWCLADVSSVGPSSEQTEYELCNGPNIDSEDNIHVGCRNTSHNQQTVLLRITSTRTINQTQTRLTWVTTNNGPSPDYSNPDGQLQPTTNIDSPGSQPTTVLRTTPSRTINQLQTRLTWVTTNNSPPDYTNPDDQPTTNPITWVTTNNCPSQDYTNPDDQPTTNPITWVTTNNCPSQDYTNPNDQPTTNISYSIKYF